MLKQKTMLKLAALATLLSLFLAVILSTTLLTEPNNNIGYYLNNLIPPTPLGALLFILILTPAMAIGLPRQIAALSAGFLFSASYGVMLATLSAALACAITCMVSRTLLANIVEQKYPLPLAKVSHFFNHNTFLKALIIRLLPAGSNFLTNVLAGTARTKIKPYLLGSTLGFIPQMTIFSLMGAGLHVNGQQQLIASIVLLIVAILLGSYLYRKNRSQLPLQ